MHDTENTVNEATPQRQESQALNARFMRVALIVNNARKVEAIRTQMETFGYGPEQLDKARSLLESTQKLFEAAALESGEARAAVEDRRKKYDEALKLTRVHLSVARIVFRGDIAAARALLLKGRRDRAIGGWVRENLQFYNNLLSNAEWIARMEKRGQSIEVLRAARSKVQAVSDAFDTQKKEQGESEAITHARNAALEELEGWARDYVAFARIAFMDNPQQLEALGVVVE